MLMLGKIVASALVIGGINLIARRNPQLGGWIAALPVVSILSMIWLWVDGAPADDIRAFAVSVLTGLLPCFLLLGIIAFAMSQGFSLVVALGCASTVWAAFTMAAQHFGLLGG